MSNNVIPNFFIAGAHKCGTTALVEYLKDHPNIYIPLLKEPNFFAEDLYAKKEYHYIKTKEEYMDLFTQVNSDHIAVGDASVGYIYSSNAIEKIYTYNQNAKIIIMVRNPVDMAYSLHSQCLYSLYENEDDFEKAWKLQYERKKGINIPKDCRKPKLLFYEDVCKTGRQVEKVMNVFSENQVKIILFDDFINDTRKTYLEVLQFLGVPDDGKNDFKQVNTNKIHKSKIMGKFLLTPAPKKIRNLLKIFKKMFKIDSIGIRKKLIRKNTKVEKRKTLSKSFRNELITVFKEDVLLLSSLIERDLSHWL